MDRFALFHEIVATRRSIRRWVNEPVPRTHLEQILDCARLAPSDTNAQPWHFTVVTDRALIQELERLTQARFGQLAETMLARGRRDAARKLKVFEKYAAHFGTAPAVILISGEPYDSRFMREIFVEMLDEAGVAKLRQEESIKSTSLAAMNLLLGAHALGYGAVPMTGPVLAIAPQLKERLRVPDPFEPHLLIALGRPAGGQLPTVGRKSLEQITSWIEPEPEA
ncbi:MAG: nitroreductase family protein [Bacillota bacterium]